MPALGAADARCRGDVPLGLVDQTREKLPLELRDELALRAPVIQRLLFAGGIGAAGAQGRDGNLLALGQQEFAVDEILQLADVSRPVVALEQLERGRVERNGRLAKTRTAPAHEVLGEQGDV